jgi:hypothetical protein
MMFRVFLLIFLIFIPSCSENDDVLTQEMHNMRINQLMTLNLTDDIYSNFSLLYKLRNGKVNEVIEILEQGSDNTIILLNDRLISDIPKYEKDQIKKALSVIKGYRIRYPRNIGVDVRVPDSSREVFGDPVDLLTPLISSENSQDLKDIIDKQKPSSAALARKILEDIDTPNWKINPDGK